MNECLFNSYSNNCCAYCKLHNCGMTAKHEDVLYFAMERVTDCVVLAAEQAKRLFALLRDADELGFDHIYAPLPSTEGMGMALYNRMIRAASHDVVDLTAAEKK